MKITTVLAAIITITVCSCTNNITPVDPVIVHSATAKYNEYHCLMIGTVICTYSYTDGSCMKKSEYYSELTGVTETSIAAITPEDFNSMVYASSRMAASTRVFAEVSLQTMMQDFHWAAAPAGTVRIWKSIDDVEVICENSGGIIVYYHYDLGADNTRPPELPPVMDACGGYRLISAMVY